MLKNLIFIGLAYYFYNDMKQKLDGAMSDRNSLLSMLTPEQRAQIMAGAKTVTQAAGQAVSDIATAISTQSPETMTNALNAPAPTVPLSGMGAYHYRRY